MSITNGFKMFLYVVLHEKGGANGHIGETSQSQYIVLSDHDPSAEELDALLNLGYDQMRDTIEAQRYDLDALPKLPAKP